MKLSVRNLLKSSQRELTSAFGSIYPHIFELCSALCLHPALFDRQCVAPRIRHCSHKMLRIHRSICENKKLFRWEIRINLQGSLRCCIDRNTFKQMLISKFEILVQINHNFMLQTSYVELFCSKICFISQLRDWSIRNSTLWPVIPFILQRTLTDESSVCLVILITSNRT